MPFCVYLKGAKVKEHIGRDFKVIPDTRLDLKKEFQLVQQNKSAATPNNHESRSDVILQESCLAGILEGGGMLAHGQSSLRERPTAPSSGV